MFRHTSSFLAPSAVLLAIILISGCHSGTEDIFSQTTEPTASSPLVSAAAAQLLGDIDDDGQPSVADAIAILRIVVGLAADDPAADADRDGSTGVGDAIAVLRCVVGLANWPVGQISSGIDGEWMVVERVVNPAGVAAAQESVDNASTYLRFNTDGTYRREDGPGDWETGTYTAEAGRLTMTVAQSSDLGSVGDVIEGTYELMDDYLDLDFPVTDTASVGTQQDLIEEVLLIRLLDGFPSHLAGRWLQTSSGLGADEIQHMVFNNAGEYSYTSIQQAGGVQSAQEFQIGWERGTARVSVECHMLLMAAEGDQPTDELQHSMYMWGWLQADHQRVGMRVGQEDTEAYARATAIPADFVDSWLRVDQSFDATLQPRHSSSWSIATINANGQISQRGYNDQAGEAIDDSLTAQHYYGGYVAQVESFDGIGDGVPIYIMQMAVDGNTLTLNSDEGGVDVEETFKRLTTPPAGLAGGWDLAGVQAQAVNTAQDGPEDMHIQFQADGSFHMTQTNGYWEDGVVRFFADGFCATEPASAADPQEMGHGDYSGLTFSAEEFELTQWDAFEQSAEVMRFVRSQ